jgi:hypothetical protein
MATGTSESFGMAVGCNGTTGSSCILTDIHGNVVLNQENADGNKPNTYELRCPVCFAHCHTYQAIGNVGHPVPVGVDNA